MGPIYQSPKQFSCVPHHLYPRLVLWGERARNPGFKVSRAKPCKVCKKQNSLFAVNFSFAFNSSHWGNTTLFKFTARSKSCNDGSATSKLFWYVLKPLVYSMCCYLCRSNEPWGWHTSAPQMELTQLRLAVGKELFCALLVQICPEMLFWAASFNGRQVWSRVTLCFRNVSANWSLMSRCLVQNSWVVFIKWNKKDDGWSVQHKL